MGQRKTFRRVKVYGYHPGKRGQIFSKPPAKRQAFGNLNKNAAPSAANAESGRGTPKSD